MELLHLAETLGVEVYIGWPPGDWWGMWCPETRTILIRMDLDPIQHRYALAHEISHAYLGHEGCTPRQEREANKLAARILIHKTEWAWLTEAYDCHLTIADHLQVPPHLVEAYRQN